MASYHPIRFPEHFQNMSALCVRQREVHCWRVWFRTMLEISQRRLRDTQARFQMVGATSRRICWQPTMLLLRAFGSVIGLPLVPRRSTLYSRGVLVR